MIEILISQFSNNDNQNKPVDFDLVIVGADGSVKIKMKSPLSLFLLFLFNSPPLGFGRAGLTGILSRGAEAEIPIIRDELALDVSVEAQGPLAELRVGDGVRVRELVCRRQLYLL